jgi:hypothetical protein
MGRKLGEGRIVTTVSVSPEFWALARKHNIILSEALRVGLSLMFADLGEQDYDNNLNLYRKMRLFQDEAQRLGSEMEELKSKATRQ